jgi:transcriptional regulator with XRE-family HTH domain
MGTSVRPTELDEAACERLLAQMREVRKLPEPSERRCLRTRAGVPARLVAEAMRTTPQAITAYERGERTPRGRTLTAYLAILDILGDGGATARGDGR